MTTIAYDGRYLAVDSQATSGHVRMGPRVKLEVQDAPEALGGGKVAFSLAGRPELFPRLIEWWMNGADPTQPVKGWDKPDADTGTCFIVARPGVVEYCWGDAPHLISAHTPDHWGSGGEHAHAAMLCGMTAPEAVAIASMMDTNSGGDILYVDLQAELWEVVRVPQEAVQGYQEHTPNHRRFMPLPDSWMASRDARQWGSERAAFDLPAKPLVSYAEAMGENPERTKARHQMYQDLGIIRVGKLSGPFEPPAPGEFVAIGNICGPCGWNFGRDGKDLPPIEHALMNAKKHDCSVCSMVVKETPRDVVIAIGKPTRESTPEGGWSWRFPECAGRLIEATGCGHCLRCNREWYSLRREVGDEPRIDIDCIQLTDAQVRAISVKWNMEPEASEQHMRRLELDHWVRQWNDAAIAHASAVMQALDIQLRKMTFPDNVHLVDEAFFNPATGQLVPNVIQKRVVDATEKARRP
jgi:hypothetical protein